MTRRLTIVAVAVVLAEFAMLAFVAGRYETAVTERDSARGELAAERARLARVETMCRAVAEGTGAGTCEPLTFGNTTTTAKEATK